MKYLVGTRSEFSPESRKILTVDGEKIVVVMHDGEFHALSAVCPHQGGPVGAGLVIGRVEGRVDDAGRYLGDQFSADTIDIVCPWHGWEFDIRTGESACLPGVGLKAYRTEVTGEEIHVTI